MEPSQSLSLRQKREQLEEKKRDYIAMVQADQQEFLNRNPPRPRASFPEQESSGGGCFSCLFSGRKSKKESQLKGQTNRNTGKAAVSKKSKRGVRLQDQEGRNMMESGYSNQYDPDSSQQQQQQQQRQEPETHGFSTNMMSNEWLEYLTQQLENNLQSSSVTILGFNWSEQLYDFINDVQERGGGPGKGFQVQKYRSAIFYLNYSVRQMRISSDLDVLIRRKQTVLNKRLLKLDQYPATQNFYHDEDQGKQVVIETESKLLVKVESRDELDTGVVIEQQEKVANPMSGRQSNFTNQLNPEFTFKQDRSQSYQTGFTRQTSRKSKGATEHPSMLSFIYDEVTQRMKNIEDFGAPLSQLDRILLSILVQIRTNLNERDHPFNMIVAHFQKILLDNLEKIKHKFRFTHNLGMPNPSGGLRGRALSRPDVVEINYTNIMEEEKKFDDEMDEQFLRKNRENDHHIRQTSFRMPDAQARKTALLINRGTYNRQTLNNMAQEAKYAEILIAEVKKLICMLYGTLIRFYIPVLRYEDLHEMREDIIELLTSLTVKGDLSKMILQLCRLGTKDDELTLASKFQEFRNLKPEMIGIDRLFTLNESSRLVDLYQDGIPKPVPEKEEVFEEATGDVGGSKIVLEEDSIEDGQNDQVIRGFPQGDGPTPFHQKSQNRRASSVISPQSQIEEVEPFVPNPNENFKSLIVAPKDQDSIRLEEEKVSLGFEEQPPRLTKDFVKEKLSLKPYIEAVQNLRRVRDYDTPIDKMRCITQTSKFIVQSIDSFWKDVNQVDKKKLTLDADQLLMIFIFVTVRSKVYELLAHLKFINEFSTNTLRLSKLGYCILTLEVALQQIVSLDQNLILTNSCITITNAEQLFEQTFKESLKSDFPFVIPGEEQQHYSEGAIYEMSGAFERSNSFRRDLSGEETYEI